MAEPESALATTVRVDENWRPLFDAYDYHKTGTISLINCRRLLASRPGPLSADYLILCSPVCCGLEVPIGVALLHATLWNTMAENDGQLLINYEQFLQLVDDLEQAHQAPGAYYYLLDYTSKALLPKSHRQRFIRVHLKQQHYATVSSFLAKVPFIAFLTTLELATSLFYYLFFWSHLQAALVDSLLAYRHCARQQIWRFASPVLLHSGLFHLLMNMVAQLYWGLPLELVYGWWRVTVLYVMGAICASLAGSLAGTKAAVGASGAVFALFGAYFANLFNIWPSIAESRGRRLAFLLANLTSQFTFLLLTDYLFKLHIGHWSHMGGLLTGLLLGPTLLQHSLPIGGVSLGEMVALAVPQQRLRWIALVLFIGLLSLAVSFNLATFKYQNCTESANSTSIET